MNVLGFAGGSDVALPGDGSSNLEDACMDEIALRRASWSDWPWRRAPS
jgi:hypothetical protein